MTETLHYEFEGTARWAHHLFSPDTKFDSVGLYSVHLDLTPESKAKYLQSGIQVKPAIDKSDGKVYVRFSRRKAPWMSALTPPMVFDKTGQPWNPSVIIGNGSKLKVKVVTWTGKKGVGHRLEAVQVQEHVPYEKPVTEAPKPAETTATATPPQTKLPTGW